MNKEDFLPEPAIKRTCDNLGCSILWANSDFQVLFSEAADAFLRSYLGSNLLASVSVEKRDKDRLLNLLPIIQDMLIGTHDITKIQKATEIIRLIHIARRQHIHVTGKQAWYKTRAC